jgi:hypothetical protein
MSATPELPPLPLDAWQPTRDTLHLYLQIVGKLRLGLAPPRNHWWHATLYVSVRGLTTRRLLHRGVTFEVELDFLEHELVVRTADGRRQSLRLRDGLSVAEFDRELHRMLGRLGVDVELVERPFGVPTTTPFTDDTEHASYDGESVRRFWRILDWVDGVLEEFSGWYCGKTSPVHVFWHSLDIAVTRFSGPRIEVPDGADPVTREAYSHELISFGFWPGDANLGEPAFYSYTAPEPSGLAANALVPGEASWREGPTGHLAVLPYEAVRTAPDPRRTLLAFLESAYEAGSREAGWDREELASSFCPAPGELASLLTASR